MPSARVRRWTTPAVACLLAAAWACAPKLAPAPVVTSPRYPDFVFPASPPELARGELTLRQQRGWQFLQAGDIRGARREFNAALKTDPSFYPAETGLAYSSLADRDYGDAVGRFARVLRRAPSYVPALVGRGDALMADGKGDEAIKSFQAALAADPALPDVRRRLDVLAFRSQQESLTIARQAAEAGRNEQALDAYQRAIESSPDSAFLYRELAAVERRLGKRDAALGHLRRAAALDPSDARSLTQMAELLEESGDFSAAADAYSKAQAVDPSDELAARASRARARADQGRLPEEYRAIPGAAQVTRGELAALIGVRLSALIQTATRHEMTVVTDVRGHWAAAWIMTVVRAGVMEPYPNHTFAPRGLVRRLDLAQVVNRVLTLIAVRRPGLSRQWQAAPSRIGDIPVGHLGYPAANMAVAADVMPLVDGGNFRPARLVTGAEAIDVVGRLEVLSR